MDECNDSSGDANVFTTLDAYSSYWNIEAGQASRENRLHFSPQLIALHGNAVWFEKSPGNVSRRHGYLLAQSEMAVHFLYLADIVIFSNTPHEYIAHTKMVSALLIKTNVTMKLKKCAFLTNRIDCLGHVARPGRLEAANLTADGIHELKLPTTATELGYFLGLCNLFR